MEGVPMKNLVKLYNQSQKEGANWYPEALAYCEGLSTKYQIPLANVVGALSALSPGTNWERNKLETGWLLAGIKGIKVPKFKFTTYGANVIKAERIALGEDPMKLLNPKTGPKTFYFYLCILGCNQSVCIDRHAYTIATGETYKGLTPKQYRLVAEHYQKSAKRLGVMPSQLQAVLWVDYRNKLQKDLEVPF
jgi:hypothetical protein